MAFGTLLGLSILAFFFLSFFDKGIRDKGLNLIQSIIDKIFKKTPELIDVNIVDPLESQINKFTSGRQVGGIKVSGD